MVFRIAGNGLADLGAEAIEVEPLEGDHTRKPTASGAGVLSHLQPQRAKHRRRPRNKKPGEPGFSEPRQVAR
jgi:crotonobetainyl-CoA:carnitine CoA-transferase CaiB-like acyl-CoA transferase